MIVLALIPSISVLAVSARAAAHGFAHGALTALGIVAADVIFILVAVYGLVFIAEALGEQFTWVRYIGAAYLIWLGISMWRAEAKTKRSGEIGESSPMSSFLAGFLLTFGDQKAILFYLGFFPAFFDLRLLTPLDTLLIILVATLGVGGPKLLYAWLADRASLIFDNRRAVRGLNLFAAVIMIAVGVVLVLKTQGWL
jgi:threonine/homoserine/homoserine lactone efflux protein